MRRRLAPLLIALATLGTIGATAAHADSTSPQPWACIGEKDIQKSVCLYPIVPDPPSSTAISTK